MGDNMHMAVEEDDLDFNPLLRGETPSEASSSLSTENEGPCGGVEKNIQNSLDGMSDTPASRHRDKLECYNQESVNEDEGTVMQFDDPSGKAEMLASSIQQVQMVTCIKGSNKGISSKNGSDGFDSPTKKNLLDMVSSLKNNHESTMDAVVDDEDAICMRTRARHSLANYTLEELETFLQESDDDDDLQNIDDEEEYHKFLASVLLEGDSNGTGHLDRNFDEDEDNDADFEVELEEALESDVEETTGCSTEQSRNQGGEAHVPETRQKKRLKESEKGKKFLLGQAKLTLRPILPYMSNSQRPPFPSSAYQLSSPYRLPQCSTSFSGDDLINGFTACQIGQLHCLIHEHVQLLLQVFSVCVLDPSRQQVASDVRKLISEMVERHEMELAWMKVPYPLLCFHPSNLHSSLQVDSDQAAGCYWTPVIDNTLLSILDVAPLRLAKTYMDDVAETVSRHRQSCLEEGHLKSHSKKEPLFASPMSASLGDTSSDFLGETMTTQPAVPLSSSCQHQSGQQQPKKTLAATLVESTMKQSVALVPADIAKLAQRFLHLFNAALFPHKPPTPAVANRVLFTDAEDGLLAMGLMEHNNDWLAIQQHFLPCKSKHQIFVRQKNRSSSKAPENPIKAVKRIKASPLSEDEKALIYEGLKIFKHDWLSVWKYFVPHRDPSMLPRQWRIATGTQKSYKTSEAVKEKRRLYEAKRRLKARMSDPQTSEKEVNDEDNSEGDMDCEDEAYVHEAFLADLEAGSSKNMPNNLPLPSINSNDTQAIRLMQYKGNGNSVSCASVANDRGASQHESGTVNMVLNSSKLPKDVHSLHQFSQFMYGGSYGISSRHLSSCLISKTSGGHLVTQSYRARKKKGLRVVKLAPDLPPVNLPPSVRVMSQSAFKIYHGESLHSNISDNAMKDHTLRGAHFEETGGDVTNPVGIICKLPDNGSGSSRSDGSNHAEHANENASESDVQLHPLLFQNPSYFPLNCQNTAPSAYNFLLASQDSVSIVSTADPNKRIRGSDLPTTATTIEFHPLLQRPETTGDDLAIVSSFDGLSAGLRTPQVTVVSQVGTGAESECQSERMNQLDLDIHLSSTREKEKTGEICEHQNVEPNAYTSEERIMEKVVHAKSKPFDLREKDLEASKASTLSVQSTACYSKDGFCLKTTPPIHDSTCQQCIGDFHEESNPGIIMEQEELSDSEDESQNVVFECEDLEDSEEEDLSGQPPTRITNKVQDFGGKDDKTHAVQDLQQLQQSSSVLQTSVKRGKRCRTQMSQCLHHTNLRRSRNENGNTKEGSNRNSLNTFVSHPACSGRRVDESKILQDLGVGTVESKASGSRRSRRRCTLD